MKKLLIIIGVTIIAVFFAFVNNQTATTVNATIGSSSDCVYIGSSSFNINNFWTQESDSTVQKTNTNDSDNKTDKTENTGDTDAIKTACKPTIKPLWNAANIKKIKDEIASFAMSTIPNSINGFSTPDLLIGEIARSDVRMSASGLKFKTDDKLIAPPSDETVPVIASAKPSDETVPVIASAKPSDETAPVIASAKPSTDTNSVNYSNEVKKLQKIWNKNPKKCIKTANKLLAEENLIPPIDLAEIWYRKGRSHRLVGEPLSAIKAHKMAAEIIPDSASYLNGYAWILSSVKPSKYRNPQLALNFARKAVKLSERKSGNYLDTLARTLYAKGYREEAFAAQKDAVQLEPGRGSFRRRLRKYNAAIMTVD